MVSIGSIDIYSINQTNGSLTFINNEKSTFGYFNKIILSNDNTSLYSGGPSLIEFSRNSSSGLLSRLALTPTPVILNFIGPMTFNLSPDGLFGYVTDYDDAINRIYPLSRNPTTGLLSFIQGPVKETISILSPLDMIFSNNSKFCFIFTDTTIFAYNRNVSTNTLTLITSIGYAVTSLQSGVISPDGLFTYIIDRISSTVIQIKNTLDVNGYLIEFVPDGGGQVGDQYGIAVNNFTAVNIYDIKMSPDGLFVYITSANGSNINALFILNRDLVTGVLSFNSTMNLTVLSSAAFINMSDDGNYIYFWNQVEPIVEQYSRNSSTGLLTLLATPSITLFNNIASIELTHDGLFAYIGTIDKIINTFSISTGNLIPITNAILFNRSQYDQGQIKISQDGLFLYLTSIYFSIEIYSRNVVTGFLTFIEIIRDSNSINRISISPDGTAFYIVSTNLNLIIQFDRNISNGNLQYHI